MTLRHRRHEMSGARELVATLPDLRVGVEDLLHRADRAGQGRCRTYHGHRGIRAETTAGSTLSGGRARERACRYGCRRRYSRDKRRVESSEWEIGASTQSDFEVGVIMYKASFKEPDSSLPPQCPRCGADGLPVGPETLRAHLASDAVQSLGEPASRCATEACPVAYFDLFERSVDADAAHGLYWPKDPAGPLCCCHGLTVDDVDADLAEPVPARVRAVVQKAGQPDAACATKSPDGRPCVARVQRYYMRQKQKE